MLTAFESTAKGLESLIRISGGRSIPKPNHGQKICAGWKIADVGSGEAIDPK
jgi:hypothetical protein